MTCLGRGAARTRLQVPLAGTTPLRMVDGQMVTMMVGSICSDVCVMQCVVYVLRHSVLKGDALRHCRILT
jgi:hypothetical protein